MQNANTDFPKLLHLFGNTKKANRKTYQNLEGMTVLRSNFHLRSACRDMIRAGNHGSGKSNWAPLETGDVAKRIQDDKPCDRCYNRAGPCEVLTLCCPTFAPESEDHARTWKR